MAQKLLLVNSEIQDTNVLADSCLPNVSFLLYNYHTDTYESLLQKVADLGISTFDEVGFIFHGSASAPTFKLLNSQLVDSLVESSLDTWSEFSGLLNSLKTIYAVQNVDLFACNFYSNPDWKYVLNALEVHVGIHIRASTDETGNMANGGNWIMETDGTNIQSIYFNENIVNYRFVFSSVSNYIMIIATDGKVYGCGYNGFGQLGIDNTTQQTSLVQMNNPPSGKVAKSVSYGGRHTIVLMTDNTIYGCGINDNGQLGTNNTASSTILLTPLSIPTGKVPKFVTCGGGHTIVLMTDNTIWGCGYNGLGQLGTGDITDKLTITAMWIPTDKVPKSVISASSHTIVLMTDGTIFGCGNNNYGLLGNGNTTQQTSLVQMSIPTGKVPKSVSTGYFHTIVLMTDNTIYGYGSNSSGELGAGNTTDKLTITAMLNDTGKVPKYTMCSGYGTIVVMTDNTIYGCGDNGNGQLGIGNTTKKSVLTGMTTNGTIYASLLAEQLPNNVPTGSVNISGNAAVGQTLTASNTLADANGLGTISYQWKSNGTAISSATNSTYTLLQAQLGTNITVTASYTDGAGTDESVTSTATSAVSAPPSAPTGLVATPGNNQVSITFTPGAINGSAITNYSYSTNNGANYIAFSPADSASPVVITNLTNGTTYTILLKAENSAGLGTASASVTALPYTNPNAPTLLVATAGNAQISVTFSSPTINGVDFSNNQITKYQYSTNNGTNWSDRTDSGTTASPVLITKLSTDGTTTLTNGTTYTILLRAVNYAGQQGEAPVSGLTATPYTSPAAPTSLVATAGNQKVVIVFTPSPNNGSAITTYKYSTDASSSWFTRTDGGLETTPIIITTLSTNGTTPLTNGTSYTILIQAVNAAGGGTPSASVSSTPVPNSPANGYVTIDGSAQVGQTLTANTSQITDADGLGTFNYIWKANGTAIGTNTSTYLLTLNELSKTITVIVTFTDNALNAETIGPSAATSPVIPANSPAIGTVTIAGTLVVGKTLTAQTSTIVDANGISTFTYQWLYSLNGTDWTNITSATSNTYTLTTNEAGKYIEVIANYTDRNGYSGTITSSATAKVNALPTGTLTIVGPAEQGRTLTILNNIADANGLGSFSYQWYANNVAIGSATASSYLLTANEVDKLITVTVSYTDANNTVESITSSGVRCLSTWLINKNNANLIYSIYVKGFIDISGGDFNVRNGNLYIGNNATMNGNVFAGQNVGVGITSPSYSLDVSGNTIFRNNLSVIGDASINGNLLAPNTIRTIPSSAIIDGSVITSDATMNSKLFVARDISMNSRLFVSNDVLFSANVYTYGKTIQLGDASMNNKLFGANDVSLNGNVYINNDLTINGRLIVQQYTNNFIINANTINYNNLTISEDISLNGRLYVNNNVSTNGRTVVSQDLTANSRLFVYGDVSLNGNVYAATTITNQGDVSMNSRLFVKGDVSMNGRLYVANGITATVTQTSDYRIKQNVKPLGATQFTVDLLRPVYYDNMLSNKPEFGLIAHEVQSHFPFAVTGEKDGHDYQTVNYIEFISLLIHEVKQLKQMNELIHKLLPTDDIL